MIELLLTIIAACLLFGSAAVLGLFETAFWLILFLAVVLIVVLAVWGLVKGAAGIIRKVGEIIRETPENWANRSQRRRCRSAGIKPPPKIHGVRLTDWEDYLDWANREGRWSGRTSGAQDERAGSGALETVCELPARTGQVGNSQREIDNDDIASDVANSVRRLLATSVLSLPKGEFAEGVGRPLSPEIAALIQMLLRERPDLQDYILDELRRRGWRVDGL